MNRAVCVVGTPRLVSNTIFQGGNDFFPETTGQAKRRVQG